MQIVVFVEIHQEFHQPSRRKIVCADLDDKAMHRTLLEIAMRRRGQVKSPMRTFKKGSRQGNLLRIWWCILKTDLHQLSICMQSAKVYTNMDMFQRRE